MEMSETSQVDNDYGRTSESPWRSKRAIAMYKLMPCVAICFAAVLLCDGLDKHTSRIIGSAIVMLLDIITSWTLCREIKRKQGQKDGSTFYDLIIYFTSFWAYTWCLLGLDAERLKSQGGEMSRGEHSMYITFMVENVINFCWGFILFLYVSYESPGENTPLANLWVLCKFFRFLLFPIFETTRQETFTESLSENELFLERMVTAFAIDFLLKITSILLGSGMTSVVVPVVTGESTDREPQKDCNREASIVDEKGELPLHGNNDDHERDTKTFAGNEELRIFHQSNDGVDEHCGAFAEPLLNKDNDESERDAETSSIEELLVFHSSSGGASSGGSDIFSSCCPVAAIANKCVTMFDGLWCQKPPRILSQTGNGDECTSTRRGEEKTKDEPALGTSVCHERQSPMYENKDKENLLFRCIPLLASLEMGIICAVYLGQTLEGSEDCNIAYIHSVCLGGATVVFLSALWIDFLRLNTGTSNSSEKGGASVRRICFRLRLSQNLQSLGVPVNTFTLGISGFANVLGNFLLIVTLFDREEGCTYGIAFLFLSIFASTAILLTVCIIPKTDRPSRRWTCAAIACLQLLWLFADALVTAAGITQGGNTKIITAAKCVIPLSIVFRKYCTLVFYGYFTTNRKDGNDDGSHLELTSLPTKNVSSCSM